MKPIFILNAPPRCGKDTIARQFILDNDNPKGEIQQICFKDPMYCIFAATTGLAGEDFMKLYETEGWKDSPQEITGGKTPRELMIHLSENYVKPFFSEAYFGEWVARQISAYEEEREEEYTWVIPDGGFQEELDAMIKVHGDRIVLIHLEREGHRSFTGDSRDWIFDWKTFPEDGAMVFDTTEGNEEVLRFMESLINAA